MNQPHSILQCRLLLKVISAVERNGPGSKTTHFVPCMTTFITVYVYHLSVLLVGALFLVVFLLILGQSLAQAY